jgi:uncharacterized NAD(P)/FAD-binding protein YdhS
VDLKGALIDSSGRPSPALYVIGPARKGSLWETIAVPELHTQASELAEHLACTLEAEIEPDLADFAMAEDADGEEATP